MLGPSGSGKTTCLRLIAGFDQPTSGHIEIFGETAEGVPPYRRNVNTVFQDYALFPHMNVRGERRLRADGEGCAARGAAGARRGGAGARQARGHGDAPSGAALRRTTAARGACARAGQPAEGAAPRRAARRARPEAPRSNAGRTEGAAAEARHHLRLRHPRPGRGAVDGRPRSPSSTTAVSSSSGRRATSTSGRRRASSPISSARPTSSIRPSPRRHCGVDGWTSVRPESIALGPPGIYMPDGRRLDGTNPEGMVTAIQYHGAVTRVTVDVDGTPVGVIVPAGQLGVRTGERVTLSWREGRAAGTGTRMSDAAITRTALSSGSAGAFCAALSDALLPPSARLPCDPARAAARSGSASSISAR